EGTVGGHWGLISDSTRAYKFVWGEAVSDHAHWPWQAAGGVVLAALIFGAGYFAQRRSPLLLTATATISGIFVGWAVENATVESLGLAGWLRSTALVLVAIAAPIGCAAFGNTRALRFDRILAAPEDRTRDGAELAAGVILIAICLLAIQAALGLVFDPRY